jgi:hypothetical protein
MPTLPAMRSRTGEFSRGADGQNDDLARRGVLVVAPVNLDGRVEGRGLQEIQRFAAKAFLVLVDQDDLAAQPALQQGVGACHAHVTGAIRRRHRAGSESTQPALYMRGGSRRARASDARLIPIAQDLNGG